MLLQPFTSLLEECAAAASSNRLKNLTGDIQDLSESMTPENLKALDAAHDGIYAFLAFDPTVDVEIRNYLLSPSAGRDSGKNILLLFTTSVSAGTSPSAAPSDYPAWLVVNGQTHVSNEIAREAFASSSTSLQFPGVLFMERMGRTDRADLRQPRSRDYGTRDHSLHPRAIPRCDQSLVEYTI